jgi:hypothetical protein
MPGSMAQAIKRRQLRHIGNKSSIPSDHPDGNKGSPSPGPFGRASMSQLASGPIDSGAFQGGAGFSPSTSPHSTHVHVAIIPPGRETAPGIDMQANKARKRTPAGDAVPPGFSKKAMARRQKGM